MDQQVIYVIVMVIFLFEGGFMSSSWANLKNKVKMTAFLRLYAFAKIPLLSAIRPTLLEVSDQRVVLKVPLTRFTKNHMGVMYFGALSMGAEAAVAIKAVHAIQKNPQKIDFIFKDFKANFIKRADGNVHFICEQGEAVLALVEKAAKSGVRENQTFHSYAIVPSKDPNLKIAEFEITLSLKRRKL